MGRPGVCRGCGAQSSQSWSPECALRLYQGFGVDHTLVYFPRNIAQPMAANGVTQSFSPLETLRLFFAEEPQSLKSKTLRYPTLRPEANPKSKVQNLK